MLSPELAAEIVRETMERVHRNINIMDRSGTIIASGDPARIGQYHEAAAEAIRRNESVAVDGDDMQRYEGTQSGVNVPIEFRGQPVGVIGITGAPHEVQPIGQLLKMTTELMIRQNDLKLQEEWRQFTADLIVEELVRKETPDEALLEQRLETLRLRFEPPYQVAIASCDAADVTRASGGLLARAAKAIGSEQLIVSSERPQKLVLLFSQAEEAFTMDKLQRLATRLERESLAFRIAVSNPVATRHSIRLAYCEADLALQYGGANHGAIVRFDAVEAEALVHTIPAEHRQRLLAKFAPHWSAKVRETLEHYFRADLTIAGAASSLGIHRNTMLYRLEQIKTLTGYDPQRFEHAMLLQFALWLAEQ
jgi:carbohydrate diacid regulator